MELTEEQLDKIDEFSELKGYTKSHYFVIGVRLSLLVSGDDVSEKAFDSFERGTKNNSCVCCMYYYSMGQKSLNKFHLTIPLAIESAIRGHRPSMHILVDCYKEAKPAPAYALVSFWIKTMNEVVNLEDKRAVVQKERYDANTEKERKENKKRILNQCFVCGKQDSKERTFHKCGVCKHYSYCRKECQLRHWKTETGNHMAECRQFMILKEYFKPRYVREIRDAVIAGDDPKDIPRLQTLRTQLGLNRPKEDYEELLLCLNDNNNNNNNNSNRLDLHKYLVGRKDGTVHIGSTPSII